MSQDLLILSLLLVSGFILLFLFINKKLSQQQKPQSDETLLTWLKSMQTSLESTNKTLNTALNSNSDHMVRTLQENSRQLNERLDKAAAVIKDVGVEVGQMSEIGRSMRELQEFLKSPKMRGNIGEETLKDLIGQMFPKNSFHLQYQFKSGERVDAAIKTDGGILPIDSKFPMESFQRLMKAENPTPSEKNSLQREFTRDVKGHIDIIAKKYILPDEGTMDFALMYVPSEAVYYELCNLLDLMEYARRKRVYLVSPSTLYAHLQTILLSFEGKKIESRSREVFRLLRSMQLEYDKVNDNLQILGKHLGNAQSQYTNLSQGFTHLGSKLHSTSILEKEVLNEIEDGTN